jgi:hypothetical protein
MLKCASGERYFDLKTERRIAYKDLVIEPEVKIPLGKPRSRSENNIKMDLTET